MAGRATKGAKAGAGGLAGRYDGGGLTGTAGGTTPGRGMAGMGGTDGGATGGGSGAGSGLMTGAVASGTLRTQKTPEQTEQRARTPSTGTLAGSTRNTV